jgi:hypothetical protein
MNKPDPLKFEYEKLFNKDGEVVAYHVKRVDSGKFATVKHNFGEPYVSFYIGQDHEEIFPTKYFNVLRVAVERYNAKHCKHPVLDGFAQWQLDEVHGEPWSEVFATAERSGIRWDSFLERLNEYKQTLQPDYFVEKK